MFPTRIGETSTPPFEQDSSRFRYRSSGVGEVVGRFEEQPAYPNRNRQPLIDNMLRQQNKLTPRFGFTPETRRTIILVLWAVSICCVVVGSLLPAASPLMIAIGRLHVWDKLQHFSAYVALSFLPVIGFRDRQRGLAAGFSMFFLGCLLELGQHFSPGRAMEFGDVMANGAGVSCGALLGLPFRTLIAML